MAASNRGPSRHYYIDRCHRSTPPQQSSLLLCVLHCPFSLVLLIRRWLYCWPLLITHKPSPMYVTISKIYRSESSRDKKIRRNNSRNNIIYTLCCLESLKKVLGETPARDACQRHRGRRNWIQLYGPSAWPAASFHAPLTYYRSFAIYPVFSEIIFLFRKNIIYLNARIC